VNVFLVYRITELVLDKGPSIGLLLFYLKCHFIVLFIVTLFSYIIYYIIRFSYIVSSFICFYL